MRERDNQTKLGHQAPKNWRVNRFNSVEIEGDFAYCASHNFVYNVEEEQRKLYNGEPCYYTDARFVDGPYNFYNNTKLHWTRWKDISLKACMRKVRKCKGIPVGTLVGFNKSWYYTRKKIDNSFVYKVRKENPIDIKYEITLPEYTANFTSCEFSKKLTEALRANGFIVSVKVNTSFLGNMMNTAVAYVGGKELQDTTIKGEVAVAYGHGKKIGFSSYDDDYMGYSNGRKNVLFDNLGEFNKWSRCREIDKSTPINEIIDILKEPNPVEEEEVVQ